MKISWSTIPGGTILDLSLLKSDALPGDGNRYRISPGQQLGEAYISLYKRYGVTIPGGSCFEVGAGGHITGGGYGVLSRLHGLTIDWVSAIEILTVDKKGHVALGPLTRSMSLIFFALAAAQAEETSASSRAFSLTACRWRR